MQTAVDKFGRVVLPKAVRQRLGIMPGEKLDVQEANGAVILVLTKQKNPLKKKGAVLVFSGKITDTSVDPLADLRESRLDELQ